MLVRAAPRLEVSFLESSARIAVSRFVVTRRERGVEEEGEEGRYEGKDQGSLSLRTTPARLARVLGPRDD